MSPRAVAVIALTLSACASATSAGPEPTPIQQPIENACKLEPDAQPAAASGLTLTTIFSGTKARAKITNHAAKTRVVAPKSISVCVGPCAGHFAECEQRRGWDSDDEPAIGVSLASGETLELVVDAAVSRPASRCEKIAVIATLDVDGTHSCAELGRFIALRD